MPYSKGGYRILDDWFPNLFFHTQYRHVSCRIVGKCGNFDPKKSKNCVLLFLKRFRGR